MQGIVVRDYLGNINRAIDWLYSSGIINENFVYLDLKRRIALETPAFATLGNGEIDFYVKALGSERTYAVEVKSGKNSGKTA